MTEQTIAGFIARNAGADDSSINRVAQAFHTLVREDEQRQRMIALAHDQAAASPFGSTEGFEDVWDRVAERLLTSYSDKAVRVEHLRARALDDAHAGGHDRPDQRRSAGTRERVARHGGDERAARSSTWRSLLDLLGIEQDDRRWGTLMRPVVALLEDLMLVGDFDAAATLLSLITESSKPGHPKERRQHALIAIDMLVSGSMMRHIVGPRGDDGQRAVRSREGHVRVARRRARASDRGNDFDRRHATASATGCRMILVAFGQAGRRQVERLKNSDNPAVRRTAIMLLREFGGRRGAAGTDRAASRPFAADPARGGARHL